MALASLQQWMDFTTSLVSSVAWPAVVLIVVVTLKEELRKLIPDIRRFAAGPLEVEFGRTLGEVRQNLKSVATYTPRDSTRDD